MFHESLIRLEVPTAWGVRLAGPFATLMWPADRFDTAQRFEALFVMVAGTAHPLLFYLWCSALREVVDGRWEVGLSPNRLTNDETTNIGLMV